MKYDIFISYRKKETADKAEYLFSLLEKAGFEGRVSFDKENLDGRFDLEILRRLDACKDFIVVLSPSTLSLLKSEDTTWYERLVNSSVEEFPDIEKQMIQSGRRLDFVRLEIGRAIAKGKHVIPLVPANTDDYVFDKLKLPYDISLIVKEHAVKYQDTNDFMFKDIVPKVVKRLKSRPKNKRVLIFMAIALMAVATIACVAGWMKWNGEKSDFRQCRTMYDYEMFAKKSFFFTSECEDSIMTFKKLCTAFVPINDAINTESDDSIKISWGNDCSLRQIRVLHNLINYMMLVEKGTFTMGAAQRLGLESVEHEECIDEDYFIGKFEVTEREWNVIMNDSVIGSDKLPVTNVSWNDCQRFVRKLQSMTGMLFSLPTEKQWEYAARKGGEKGWKYAGSDDPVSVAVFDESEYDRPERIDIKSPNALELYNMSGNVSEWCQNGDENKKVVRGGSFISSREEITVSYCDMASTDYSSRYVGLRLVLNINENWR